MLQLRGTNSEAAGGVGLGASTSGGGGGPGGGGGGVGPAEARRPTSVNIAKKLGVASRRGGGVNLRWSSVQRMI